MNAQIAIRKKSKGYIKTSTLVILAFAPAFFSRLLHNVGIPSTINFLHFATVPFVWGVALATSRAKNRNQIAISWAILSGLLFLLGVMVASALLNHAGLINVILDFLLLGEPFMLLLAIICTPMPPASLEKLRTWLIRFSVFHVFLAYFQNYVLHYADLQDGPDNIQGVFYRSGAGHVVGASVAFTFGLYYFSSAKTLPIWNRASVLFATFWQIIISDTKQVLMEFLVAWMLLLVTKLKDIATALKYLIAFVVVGCVLWWCIENLEAFDAYKTWIRPEIYGPNGDATLLKTATFRIVPSYYHSPLHPWLGLGPGHTVGRLGGWMIGDYWDLLGPLGATIHPCSTAVWAAVGASWLGSQSSMFSPLFGWAGIWGDLGLLGLGAYLYLSYLVWSRICLDDFTKFLMLSIFITGLIFSQMEEPGYMLYMSIIIGCRWQEHQRKQTISK